MSKSVNSITFNQTKEPPTRAAGGAHVRGNLKHSLPNKPLVTVITVVFNGASTIEDTIQSVINQTYSNIEYIIVDGGSTDVTLDIIRKYEGSINYWISEKDAGVYDAMNKGIALATGEIVGFLNADDVYIRPDVLNRVVATMSDSAVDACYADLIYVQREQTDRVVRFWKSRDYQSGLFEKGWMPAHPTFFVRKSVYQKLGGFDLRYRLQADFDLALRFIAVHGIQTRYVPEIWVRMRMGGMSNNSIRNILRGNLEAHSACRNNGLRVPPWFILGKVISRIPQFISAYRMKPDRSDCRDNRTLQKQIIENTPEDPIKKLVVVRVVTASYVVPWHLANTLKRASTDFEVCVVGQDVSKNKDLYPDIKFVDIDIHRTPRPISDCMALFALCRFFLFYKPDIVHSIMPKAGLLTALAGFICRIPVRIHTFTGQTWVTRTGLARYFLYMLDRLIVSLNTICLTDSFSQSAFLLEHKISNSGQPLPVLSKGSLSGVDVARFNMPRLEESANQLRADLGLGKEHFVFAFIARKTRAKGAIDMLKAFSFMLTVFKDARLLFVGPDEDGEIERLRKTNSELFINVIDVDHVNNHEVYLAVTDVLCLPSYREGFGSIVIDAAAMGIPTIGSCIPGITDSIVDQQTGVLFPAGNVEELAKLMLAFIENPQICQTMGSRAKARVEDFFTADHLYAALNMFYLERALDNRITCKKLVD